MLFLARRSALNKEDGHPSRRSWRAARAGDGGADYLSARGRLDLPMMADLVELPPGLKVRRLDLSGCTGLLRLPEGLEVRHLDVSGCTALTGLPRASGAMRSSRAGPGSGRCATTSGSNRASTSATAPTSPNCAGLKVGSLVLRAARRWPRFRRGSTSASSTSGAVPGCRPGPTRRRSGSGARPGRVPADHLAAPGAGPPGAARRLGLRGPARAARGLQVGSWIEIANTGITSLPDSLAGVNLRWRGVPIDGRIASIPGRSRSERSWARRTAERRRVLLERVGSSASWARPGPRSRRGPRPRRRPATPARPDARRRGPGLRDGPLPVHQGTLPAPRPADREDLPPRGTISLDRGGSGGVVRTPRSRRPRWRQVFTVGGTRSR